MAPAPNSTNCSGVEWTWSSPARLDWNSIVSFSPTSRSISWAFGCTSSPSIVTLNDGPAGVDSSSAVAGALSVGVGVVEVDGVADDVSEVGSEVGSGGVSVLEQAASAVTATSVARVLVVRMTVSMTDLLES